MFIGACGSDEPPKVDGRVRVVRFGYPSEPPTLDPLAPTGASEQTRDILRPILPALFSLDDKLRPRPDLVAAWPARRDITTSPFTVKLRLRNARWSDGRPITSRDVRFSWEKLRKGPTGYRYRYLKDVRVLGPRTLRLHFDRTMRRWWSLFSLDDMVLPAHAYAPSWKERPSVSGGPFVFKGWTKGLKIELVRNERYWNKARVGAIDVFFVPSNEVRLKLLDRGELDAFFAPGDSNMGRRAAAYGFRRTNKALDGGEAASGAWGSAWWELDLDPSRMGHHVAAAIGQAIDPALAAEIFEDSGQIADGIPRRFPVDGPKADNRPTVPGPWAGRGSRDAAKRTLAAAPPGSPARVIAAGGTVNVTLAFDRNSGGAQLAGFIHFRLLPLRIRAEVVGLDADDLEELLASPKAPPAVIRFRRGADAPDASSYVFGRGAAETAAPSVIAAETTVAGSALRSRPITGLDGRAWAAAQRQLVQARSVYPLVRARLWIIGRRLAGPHATASLSGPFWNAATWRFD